MEWVSFKDDPEYHDIVPIPQDDQQRLVFKIAYSDAFLECHDYLRALMAKDERSLRALKVTKEAIEHNPANYTTWHYRRNIISSINYDLIEESIYISNVISENSKNYQVWLHRQWVIEQILSKNVSISKDEIIKSEIEFLDSIFEDDSKNYHAWQYFRWICDRLDISLNIQLELVEELLLIDEFNNSAWNHRFYSITNKPSLTYQDYKTEYDFVTKRLNNPEKINNESAWHYFYGILNAQKPFSEPSKIVLLQEAISFAESLRDSIGKDNYRAPFFSFLFEVYIDLLTLNPDDKCLTDLKSKSMEVVYKLAEEVDIIRKNYWNYRKRQLESIELD